MIHWIFIIKGVVEKLIFVPLFLKNFLTSIPFVASNR